MKKLMLILITAILVVSVWAAQRTVTYSTKTRLGDGLFYTFTWTTTAVGDLAWVMGRDADGFLVTNMNDRVITVELVSDGTAAEVDFWVDVYGNHEADSDTAAWLCLTTSFTNVMEDAQVNTLSFNLDSLGIYPYLAYRVKLQGGSGDATQSVTFRTFFDFDDKSIGKE